MGMVLPATSFLLESGPCIKLDRMKTHQHIDQRSLDLARLIVKRIDADPDHAGLKKAQSVCTRWMEQDPTPPTQEWAELLTKPWTEIKRSYMDPGDDGARLRQNSPFCGILSPRERWQFIKQWSVDHESITA